MRLLVDAPEAIYGSLDAHDWLGAARHFACCANVHKELAAHPKQLARRFPLLHHQWPLVRKLRSQIHERAVSWLGVQGAVSAEQVADVLAALALLQPTDGAEVWNECHDALRCLCMPPMV